MSIKHTIRRFVTQDGVELVADCWGDSAAPTVLFSHGGGQTRHSWGGTARALADHGWHTVSYDHRGHGDSDWAPDGVYDYDTFGRDMKAIVDALPAQPHVVGASLGGLSAMVCAGELQAAAFASITLVDITPRLNPAGVDNIFAFMTEYLEEGFANLEEAADAIARYTGRPRRQDLSGLEKNLRLRNGRYYWHWDPDFFALRESQGYQHPHRLSDAMRAITTPVLLVRGRASDVVTQAEVDEFMEMSPHAEYVDVAHARHMVAGDRNDIFTAAVVDFLERQRETAAA